MRSIIGLFTAGAVLRWLIGAAVATAVWVYAAPAEAQDAERWQEKQRRADAVMQEGGGPNALLAPSGSTSTREYLGIEVHQGGVYNPSVFPTESWLEVACVHNDLTKSYSRSGHGSSYLRIHAIVYDSDIDRIHDTTDTEATDEALCDIRSSVDTSFIEIPRSVGRRAAGVALIIVPSRGQYVEASKIVYRVMPR